MCAVSAPSCFVELGHVVEFLVRNHSITTEMLKAVMETITVLRLTHLNIKDRAKTMLNLEERHGCPTRGTSNFENRLIFCEVISHINDI